MSVNKVTLIGRVGKEIELKHTPAGMPYVNFSIATTEKFKGRDGTKKENTEWHSLVAWDKKAEVIAKFVKKGHLLYVEGKLSTRKYADKDGGKDRYATSITVREIDFINPKEEGQVQQTQNPYEQPQKQASQQTMNNYQQPKANDNYMSDDIPF